MKKPILIFDLDGTLVDSSHGILASLSASLSECSAEPVLPLTKALIGPPLRETLGFLCAKPDDAKLDQLVGAFKVYYDSIGFKHTNPFPGVMEMLQSLAAAKIPLHIATNKRARPTAQIIELLGWTEFFDQVISPDSCSPPLPSKAAILAQLLTEANLEASDCIYVGDRVDDYKAAKEVGIHFALAAWGFEGDDAVFSSDTFRMKTPNAEQLVTLFTDLANI